MNAMMPKDWWRESRKAWSMPADQSQNTTSSLNTHSSLKGGSAIFFKLPNFSFKLFFLNLVA